MSYAPCSEEFLNSYVTTLIRVKARQLVRGGRIPSHEEEDVRQELALRLMQRAHYFDPARASLNTFAARVVYSLISALLRERGRLKNGASQTVISNEVECDCGAEGRVPLRELLHEKDLRRRSGQVVGRDRTDQIDRQDTLEAVLSALPADLREICEQLKHRTAAETARTLGLSSYRMDQAIRILRQRFSSAGLN